MTPPDDSSRRRAAERIAIVRARFVETLPAKLAALCEFARRAAGDDVAAAVRAGDALRLGLHNLSGGAPTLGFADVGARARSLEKRFIAARLSDGRIDRATADRLAAEIEGVGDAIAHG